MSCHEPVKAHGSLVACSYCPGCRSRRSATWALRLEDEQKEWDRASFLTLTVADLPLDEFLCSDRPVPWFLSRRYPQLFFKMLRRRGYAFKYYTVGEYGEKSARAHYHVLLFGLDKRDRDIIEELWPWGSVDIGSVEPASVRYVTGYVMKAPLGRLRLHEERSHNAPPFSTMSQGLGALGARARRHTIVTQGVVRLGPLAVPPPRYYVGKLSPEERSAFLASRRTRQLGRALSRVAECKPYVVNDVSDRAEVSRADFTARRKPRGSL